MSPIKALAIACSQGNIEKVHQVVLAHGITVADVRRSTVIVCACIKGRHNVIEWLANYFNLSAEDIRINDNHALIVACSSGNFETAQWLIDYFGLTEIDAQILRKEIRDKLNFNSDLGPKFAGKK